MASLYTPVPSLAAHSSLFYKLANWNPPSTFTWQTLSAGLEARPWPGCVCPLAPADAPGAGGGGESAGRRSVFHADALTTPPVALARKSAVSGGDESAGGERAHAFHTTLTRARSRRESDSSPVHSSSFPWYTISRL